MPAAPPDSGAADRAIPSTARRRRGATLAASALVVAVAAGGAVLLATRSLPPGPASPPPRPRAGSAQLRVLAVAGPVERAGNGGPWRELGTGDVLAVDDQVRAGPGGRAELAAADHARILVTDRTQVLVRELSDEVHRFRLSRGLVSFEYPAEAARRVRVEAASGDAIAETNAAHFHVSANGLVFAVAARSGTVDVKAAGSTVLVRAGELSTVGRMGPPTPPRAIPTEVLLRVAAASTLAPQACLDTTGRTDPSARAVVNGAEVQVGEDGRFPIQVSGPQRDGVTVRIVAADGRELVRTLPCGAEPSARIRDLRMRWSGREP